MVEAMLSDRPVVATNVAGHAEIIEDGVTGFWPTRRPLAVWPRR